MIFMSQSGLTDPGRETDWDVWYLHHLHLMATVAGVDSAQRFKTDSTVNSPSLAMYSMRSADVFADPYYLSIRGLGEFLPLIDKRWYRRNLFGGLDIAPAVSNDEVMLVWDLPAPRETPGLDFVWLEAVAVDKSTPYRGIAVMPRSQVRTDLAAEVAIYRPATRVFHKAMPAEP